MHEDGDDVETLAAIDRGIADAKAGRVVSLEQAQAYIDQWHAKYRQGDGA